MTSEQRREARYYRRQARRQARKQARCDALGPIEKVFSYRKMFMYGKKCCNGVRWKASTQHFELHLFSGTAKRRRKILNGTWKPGKTVHFVLRERGKIRPIDAPHIEDRQIYKVLTKEVLVPLYSPCMIYDNKASQKGGGLHFHYKRLKKHLHDHYRLYGTAGAMFLMDFHHFFPSAPHALIYERHRRLILNPDLRKLADLVVAAVPGGVGMPLGVEPSQQEMVALPSALDNRMKAQYRIHDAGHYMDDYHADLPTREDAVRMGNLIISDAEAMGLQVNRSKSAVVDISKPFRFCKAKFHMTETGRIITHGCRDGVKRARRKMHYFKAKVDAGEMTVQQVEKWLESPIAYYENFNDNGRVLKLRRLFHAIFIGGANHV
uniref:Reverse transcriptase domain-containing protein n=1 Tax=Dulem virus 34 TaxID=3145752 RepID=A0AAU8B5S1_9CAUD